MTIAAHVMLALLAGADLEINAVERRDAAILVLTPFGASTRTGSSRLVEAAAAVFERETDLRLLPAGQAGLDPDAMLACPTDQRLSCWVRLATTARLYLLLIVTVAPARDEDRAAMTMLDPNELRGLGEEEIFERIAEVEPRAVDDPEELFAAAIAGPLREFLERRGHLGAWGDARVAIDCEACTLALGERVFDVPSGTVLFRRLRAGAHELVLQRRGEPVCRTRVEVLADQTAEASCAAPSEGGRNDLLVYGGVASAVLGAAGIAAAFAVARGPTQVCVGRDESACSYVRAARSGFGGDGVEPVGAANGGFPLLPVGAGLLVAGGGWAAGGLVLEEEHWWVSLIGGAVLGGVTTAIALAAE